MARSEIFIGATVVLLAACERETPSVPPTPTQLPDHALDTAGLLLTLSASRTRLVQGEEVTITERLANVADRTIYHNCRSISRSMNSVAQYFESLREEDDPLLQIPGTTPVRGEGKLWAANGETDGDSMEGWWSEGSSRHHAIVLAPGETEVRMHTVQIRRAGVYRLSSRWTSNYSDTHASELWRGTIASNALELDVAPDPRLHDLTEALVLSIRADRSSAGPGDRLSVTGTLHNRGPRTALLALPQCSLRLREWSSSSGSHGESGCRRNVASGPSLTPLPPGASTEFPLTLTLPAMALPIELTCRLEICLDVGGRLRGTTIGPSNALRLVGSK